MTVTHKLKIDFANMGNPPHVSVVQGDSSRILEVSLYENNVAWEIPSGVSAYVSFESPLREKIRSSMDADGKQLVSCAGNIATVSIPSELTVNDGTATLIVVFVDGNSKQVATFPVIVSVVENPGLYGVEIDPITPDEFTRIMASIGDISKIADEVNGEVV